MPAKVRIICEVSKEYDKVIDMLRFEGVAKHVFTFLMWVVCLNIINSVGLGDDGIIGYLCKL